MNGVPISVAIKIALDRHYPEWSRELASRRTQHWMKRKVRADWLEDVLGPRVRWREVRISWRTSGLDFEVAHDSYRLITYAARDAATLALPVAIPESVAEGATSTDQVVAIAGVDPADYTFKSVHSVGQITLVELDMRSTLVRIDELDDARQPR